MYLLDFLFSTFCLLAGGLDVLAVDAIHTIDGDEYILEVNDCSIGFGPDSGTILCCEVCACVCVCVCVCFLVWGVVLRV